MAKSNRIFALSLAAGFCLMLFSACTKENPPASSRVFLKTYNIKDSSAIAFYIKQLPDGGFFMVSAVGNSSLVLSRINKYGGYEWEKTVLNNGFYQYYLFSTPPWIFNAFNAGDDSHFIAQSGFYIVKFDTTGALSKFVFNGTLNSELSWQGAGCIGSSCDGLLNGAQPSDNLIYAYDKDLNLKRIDTIPDAQLGAGKMLHFFVHGTAPSGAYNILGAAYPRTKFTTLDNSKLFAARIRIHGTASQTMLDTGDALHSDMITWQTTAADSGEVLLGQRTDTKSSGTFSYPVVIRFDKDLNVVWEKDFPVSSSVIFPGEISRCRDGGFIISGSISQASYGGNKLPYALRIDKDGHKLWDKTISSLAGSGTFIYGTELNDGSFGFTGASTQFGSGQNENRVLFVKTDRNGNL